MRWSFLVAVLWCALAPARAAADERLSTGDLGEVCEAEPAPPSCEDDRTNRMAWPVSPPAIVDCNDAANPLLADLVGRCDMPELLPKAFELQSVEDEPEGPASPAPGDTCHGSSCTQGDPPLSPRRTQDLLRSWALPAGIPALAAPPVTALVRWPEPSARVVHVPFILDRPPRAR